MSEEIRKQNTPPQLGDATLENVSGGALNMSNTVYEKYCNRCDCRNNCGPSGNGLPLPSTLISYINANGYPKSYRECPNYNN